MRVGWFKVITELENRGVTLRSQAETLDVSLGTLYYWKSGGEPKYIHGEKLIMLYADVVGVEPPRLTAGSTGGPSPSRPPSAYRPVQATASSTA